MIIYSTICVLIKQIFDLTLSSDKNIKKSQTKGDLVIPLIMMTLVAIAIFDYLLQIIAGYFVIVKSLFKNNGTMILSAKIPYNLEELTLTNYNQLKPLDITAVPSFLRFFYVFSQFFYMSIVYISFFLLMVAGIYLVVSSYNINLSLKYRNWMKLVKIEEDINAGKYNYNFNECFVIDPVRKKLILKKIDTEWELKSIFQIYFYDWNIVHLIFFNLFIAGWSWILMDQIFINNGTTFLSFIIGIFTAHKTIPETIRGVSIPIILIVLPVLAFAEYFIISERYYYIRKIIKEEDPEEFKRLKLSPIISQKTMIIIGLFWGLMFISSLIIRIVLL